MVALGLGLTLFVLLAAIRTSIDANIATTVPAARAVAVRARRAAATARREFRRTVSRAAPGAEIRTVPLLRGTITGYAQVRASPT